LAHSRPLRQGLQNTTDTHTGARHSLKASDTFRNSWVVESASRTTAQQKVLAQARAFLLHWNPQNFTLPWTLHIGF
jgi:hypothetical protein